MARAFGARKDINFVLIGPRSQQHSPDEQSFDNISYKRHFQNRTLSYLQLLSKSLSSGRSNPDMVFTRDIAVAVCYSLRGTLLVYELHKRPGFLANKLLKFLSVVPSFRLLCISTALKSDVETWYPRLRRHQILSYHDGVFTQDYEAAKSLDSKELKTRLEMSTNAPCLVYTGSLYKGDDIELLEVIAKRRPEINIYCIGGNPEHIRKYSKFFSQYPKVEFRGHVDRKTVIAYQVAADVLFYPLTRTNPLWKYTSPLKVFEYMAAGTPILASNIGSVSEILNSENAMLFDPEDEDSVVRGLDRLLSDRLLAAQMAEQAYSQVLSKFSWEKRVDYILQQLFESSQASKSPV